MTDKVWCSRENILSESKQKQALSCIPTFPDTFPRHSVFTVQLWLVCTLQYRDTCHFVLVSSNQFLSRVSTHILYLLPNRPASLQESPMLAMIIHSSVRGDTISEGEIQDFPVFMMAFEACKNCLYNLHCYTRTVYDIKWKTTSMRLRNVQHIHISFRWSSFTLTAWKCLIEYRPSISWAY